MIARDPAESEAVSAGHDTPTFQSDGGTSSKEGTGAHPRAGEGAASAGTGGDPGVEGTPFGRYRLVSELGRGGMGIVYRAWHPELRRYVALKVLKAGEGERLVREGQTVARLGKHPHVVQVFDAGIEGGIAYVAMELVTGSPLDDVVAKRGPLPERELAEIGYQVALALDHAHRHGLIHRDMKPANVVLDARGEAQVLDFGLAREVVHAGEGGEGAAIAGTPGYMAPEQVRPWQGVDARADVYGLGATLYALAAGRPPFEGSLAQVLTQTVIGRPAPLREAAGASARAGAGAAAAGGGRGAAPIGRDLEAVIARAMERERYDRYQSALEMADDLSRVLRGELPRARRAGPVTRALRRVRRHPVLAGLGLAVVLAGLAAFALIDRRERELRELWRGLAVEVAERAAGEARALFDPVPALLLEVEDLTAQGLGPSFAEADAERLSVALALRLRHRGIDWLGFYRADGGYAGGTRRGGEVIVDRVWRGEDGQLHEVEEVLAADGTRTERIRSVARYDPRDDLSYRTARGSAGPRWTEPYAWVDEAGVETRVFGVSCVRRRLDDEGRFAGALAADVRLTTLSALLAREAIWPEGRAYLLSPKGEVIASSRAADAGDGAVGEALVAALGSTRTSAGEPPSARSGASGGRAAAPQPLGPVRFSADGVEMAAVAVPLEVAGGQPFTFALAAPASTLRGVSARGGAWLGAGLATMALAVLAGALLPSLASRRRVAALRERISAAAKPTSGPDSTKP